MNKYTCPCCGYRAFDEEPSGTFDICDICYWEDDNLMNENPDYWGGANGVCLRQAQRNFIKFGVSEKNYLNNVDKYDYEKDPLWKPVWENEVVLNKKKLAEIHIKGNVIDGRFKESIHINDFLDAFTEFLEAKGWAFGGEIKQAITQINKD
ncbi:hypothetical protein EHS13_02115 [Paenibacillus psychroresistens]|uniref:Cysteine-rich CPCC domain-containing protein n=1 Tax=Paenibacillus psychroresistens TaxID=1778678 RepID=A0A6B8RE98_9BACL|nr:hypothetical protein EHS13_02115 [Paenibacillus psychroresistens]